MPQAAQLSRLLAFAPPPAWPGDLPVHEPVLLPGETIIHLVGASKAVFKGIR